MRIDIGHRQDAEDPVTEEFDCDAAAAEHHHRPEEGIGEDPGDDLDPAQHRLDDRPLHHLADPLRHVDERLPDLLRGTEVEPHGTDVGLVHETIAGSLERDREPELLGGGGGLIRRLHMRLADGRDAECLEHADAVPGGEPPTVGMRAEVRVHDRASSLQVDTVEVGDGSLRTLLPLRVRRDASEGAHRALGERIAGDGARPLAQ